MPSSSLARADRLADRYGRRRPGPRRRALGIATLAVLGVAALALLLAVAWRFATPDVRVGMLSFDVVDDRRVDVVFEVVADERARLACEVSAQNEARDVVGSSAVDVAPASEAQRVVAVSVPTRERAVNGLVQRCRVVR